MQIIRWTAWGFKGLPGLRQRLKSDCSGAWVSFAIQSLCVSFA